ncbi:MAG: FAD-dependent oxidoreductase [Gammaproteobacteria bacterium]
MAYWQFGDLLSLDSLERSRDALQGWHRAAPLASAAIYFAAYVAVAAASIPGAAVMTVGAGAVFGFWWGLLIVSFASSVGATLAFAASRYLLKDAVTRRFGARLREVQAAFEREGAAYLFFLRLVPVVPFFIVNLLMGLTRMRASAFYAVSQAGMLAGTAVYVNAGTQLANLEGLSGIVSPALMASFALLGAFPLAARRFMWRWQRRRPYARWRRPASFDRNLIVIGGGAAGLVAAYSAAAAHAGVTLVEAHRLGGDCLNTGCVPSKALIRAAAAAHEMRHAHRYGIASVEPVVSFHEVMARVRAVIAAIEPHDSAQRYTALGVDVVAGHARIVDPWTVEIEAPGVAPRRLSARGIVIAAGGRPFVPPIPGLDEVGYLTSDTLWDALADMQTPPASMVILGGGPIGCELAQAFARLGVRVTVVESAVRLLGREDDEVSAAARDALQADGVTVMTGCRALRCERDATGKALVIAIAGRQLRIGFDALVCAAGRVARLDGYGLEALGIDTGRVLPTNEYLETLYPNILAAGDVAGPYQFTHAAGHQAWYAAVNALFGDLMRFRADRAPMPAATFIDPEIARVGLNEREARERGIEFEVTRLDLGDLDRAIIDGTEGFVKVLTAPARDRILGATIVGAHAGELIAPFVLAMTHGLGLRHILGTVHAYPTMMEAARATGGEWRRAHLPAWLAPVLRRFHDWRRG